MVSCPSGPAQLKQTVPTGFPGSPPLGPAIPVIAKAQSAWLCFSAPTAIANAGKASIQAALQPDDTNYYFYVLNPDTQRHVFSRTLSEHNANLRKFG